MSDAYKHRALEAERQLIHLRARAEAAEAEVAKLRAERKPGGVSWCPYTCPIGDGTGCQTCAPVDTEKERF